jgi:arachidonate 15-lipoxygenase
LPTHFADTQTDRATVLPHHPYRDDGLLVWSALRRWVAEFVAAYYFEESDVRADHELQAWAQEISSPSGGCVRDFGRAPGSVVDRDDLIEILTMVIWTAGPQHAAVNFAQRDHMSFVPANPLAGYTPEPMGKEHTKADWLANLPPLDVAVHQLCVMTFLGSLRHTVFGSYGDDFKHAPVAAAHHRFLVELGSIDDEIAARNRRRAYPYEYLRPSLIPNSTNI